MLYTHKISDLLMDLPDMFTGCYTNKNSDLKQIRNEMLDISSIPSPKDDKANLKNDLNDFLKDTRKAQKEIKGKITNG